MYLYGACCAPDAQKTAPKLCQRKFGDASPCARLFLYPIFLGGFCRGQLWARGDHLVQSSQRGTTTRQDAHSELHT